MTSEMRCDFCGDPGKYYGSHHCYFTCEKDECNEKGREVENNMFEAMEDDKNEKA